MPPIVSPQPRVVPSSRSESTTMSPMSSSIYLSQSRTVPSRATISPSRLMSPIILAERPPQFNSKSLSRTALRRRSALNHSQRRRHCAQADCRFDSIGTSAFFDNLPWVSALETSPNHFSGWDIADLSQIAVDQTHQPATPPSGLGPVRRRKLSPRSSPLTSEAQGIPNCSLSEPTPFPFHQVRDSFDSRPRTPLSLIPPSRVRFHNLMPVVLDPHKDEHPFRWNGNHPHCISPPPSPRRFPASS